MIIPISPTVYNTVGNLVDAIESLTSVCKKTGYTIIDVCINETTNTLEIHAQKLPRTITVVNTSQTLQEYVEQYTAQMAPIEILPSPVTSIKPTTAMQHRTESNLIKNYNRVQNTKYNSMLRNYKGRKR